MIKWWLKSLSLCLWSLNAKFYIIADWIPETRRNDIINSLWKHDYEYIYTDHLWNEWTREKQMEILSNQDESEYIYFAEDDYVYNIYDNLGFSQWISLLKWWKSDFVSLFDHAWYYKKYMHKYKRQYIITDSKIWKSESATCLTFMTTKKVLKASKNIFHKYSKWCRDYAMWDILTKINVWRFFDIWYDYRVWLPCNKKPNLLQKFFKNFPLQFVCLWMAWRYWWKHILFWKKYRLYVPVPSVCTHLEKWDTAPITDREKVFESIDNTKL